MDESTFNKSFPYTKKNKRVTRYGFVVVVLMLLSTLGFIIGNTFAPQYLDEEIRVTIPEGLSATHTAYLLEEKGVITSAFLFRLMYRTEDYSVKAGTYLFEEGYHALSQVIHRLHTSDYGDVFVTVTIPEGSSVRDIINILSGADLENFDSEIFASDVENKEGYLFPDTYHFLPEFDTKKIIEMFEANFKKRVTEGLAVSFENSQRKSNDIIIMASLIEKEAGPNFEEQKMVAGILWKRIDRGMLLQVDAPFLYYQGKGSHQLTTADLRTDHPYNTYTRLGLTPTPIGNPGLSSIRAALEPTASEYWYYLHDNFGKIHYGVTHDDHVRNKQRYLR